MNESDQPRRGAMPRQDLSGAFTGTRAVRSPRLAPRARPAGTKDGPAEATDAGPAAPPTPAPKPARAPSTNPPVKPEAPVRAAANGSQERQPGPATARTSQVIVYLRPETTARLRAQTAAEGLTYLQLILDALDDVHPKLGQLLEDAGHVSRRDTSLFGQQVTSIGRRPTGQSKTQISVRPPASVLAVIDDLVEQHHAPNRSILIDVALDSHLRA